MSGIKKKFVSLPSYRTWTFSLTRLLSVLALISFISLVWSRTYTLMFNLVFFSTYLECLDVKEVLPIRLERDAKFFEPLPMFQTLRFWMDLKLEHHVILDLKSPIVNTE